MSLNDAQLRQVRPREKSYRLSDGGGLFVEVRPNGSKLWRLAYRFDGKQKLMALGSYPETSLARVREKRQEAKALLQDGIDPMAKAKAEKEERLAQTEHTFSRIAEEMLEKATKEGLAETTLKKKHWLLNMAMAAFGERPISEITATDILVPLRKVEAEGNYETARRLRSTIGQVFRYAIATARADNDPTFGLKGALISPKVTHRAAITDGQSFAGLVRAVWAYDGMPETQAALKLLALLYPRPGELRKSQWPEFDFEKATWTIPATRTKMRREHVKPLPKLAVDILADLRRLTGNAPFAFPSALSPGKPISENTLNGALRRMGFGKDEMTSHGFRASASSLLNESGLWNPDAIEAELAHLGADETRRTYHRALCMEDRVPMADWWAGEITSFLQSTS